jgi:hypothetical protein
MLANRPDFRKCSRAGCNSSALHLISWRNPKLHAADRIKSWAACEEHRQYLIDYLGARNFYLEDRPIEN